MNHGSIGVIVYDGGTIHLREEDKADINAYLNANGVNPNTVLLGTVMDERGGRLRLQTILMHDGRPCLDNDRHELAMQHTDVPLQVPYVKGARP